MKKESMVATIVSISVILVLFASFNSFAQGTTVTVQTSAASYPQGQAGTQIPISGSVTPAPGSSGYSVTLEFNTTQGLIFVASTSVNGATGAYSYTLTTGYAANGWINGTYVVTAVYASSGSGPTYDASASFQYGQVATTTSSSSSTSTSATSISTVTVTSPTTVVTTTTAVQTTTVPTTVTGPTVTQTTSVPTTVSTTFTSTSTVSSGTWEAVGIAGIVAAVVLAGVAVMMMRRH